MAKLTTIVVATAISLLLSPTVHAFVSVAPTPARVTKVVLFGAKLEGREIEGTSQQRRDVLQTALLSSLSFALTTMMVGTTFPSAAAAVTDDINNTPPQNVIRAPGLCAYGTGEGCDALSENNVYIQQLQQKVTMEKQINKRHLMPTTQRIIQMYLLFLIRRWYVRPMGGDMYCTQRRRYKH